jgi:hypothetical protein
MESMEKYNQEVLDFKVGLIHKVQSKLPNAVLGGSLAAYLLGLQYKNPLDIDIFSEDIEIEEFFNCLEELGITYIKYKKSYKENYIWKNNNFIVHIQYGYSIAVSSMVCFDFKRIKFEQPYTMETQTVEWKGKSIIVQTKDILEQGIRAFQNHCLDLGATYILQGKYKNIDKIFPNRKQLI